MVNKKGIGKRDMKSINKLLILIALTIILPNNVAAEKYKVGLAVWSGYSTSVQGFKDGLAENGIFEGKHVEFIQGEVGASAKLQTQVAIDFKKANVDMVYTLTTPGTKIIKEIMPAHTPLVFSIVTYPADSGLIESFDYSGNNLVGTSNYVPITYYIDMLKKLLPSAKKAAIFFRKGEPNSKIQAANLYRLLKREGIHGINVEVTSISDVTKKANKLIGKVDVFITTTDTLMQSGGEEALIKVSLSNKIPILSSNKKGIEQGSTFGVVADFYTLGKISGGMAAQILLENKTPESLQSKMQDPPTYLANRKSLNKLGISVPNSLDIQIKWTE